MAKTKQQKSLDRWTKQKWRTPSGKKSSETGEVYAPSRTISKLKSTSKGRKKLAAANKKKRAATKLVNNMQSMVFIKGLIEQELRKEEQLKERRNNGQEKRP